MDYTERWKILEELGSGGQGKVYRVLDLDQVNEESIRKRIQEAVRAWGGAIPEDTKRANFDGFRDAIFELLRRDDLAAQGALKVLHVLDQENEKAEERIKRELKAMSQLQHPSLVRILDSDSDGRWYVSELCDRGSLADRIDVFAGDPARALRAFRDLVEAVAVVHEAGMVHRDIKPENVFLGVNDRLKLGDFGLVFFSNDRDHRLSDTLENVGSRDWMPAWAMGTRVEEIRPSFDVFCLGKTLWAMLAGSLRLRLWYFERKEFDLEQRFPDAPGIELVNLLLERCIVEEEKDCLTDASALLQEVHIVRMRIEAGGHRLRNGSERRCTTCGLGRYRLIVPERNASAIHNFGLSPAGIQTFRVFTCDKCGHVQMFSFTAGSSPPVWED